MIASACRVFSSFCKGVLERLPKLPGIDCIVFLVCCLFLYLEWTEAVLMEQPVLRHRHRSRKFSASLGQMRICPKAKFTVFEAIL